MSREGFTMLALSGFAIASLVLAGVGLYGTLAYLTSQRPQELGVRLALGASAASIPRSCSEKAACSRGWARHSDWPARSQLRARCKVCCEFRP